MPQIALEFLVVKWLCVPFSFAQDRQQTFHHLHSRPAQHEHEIERVSAAVPQLCNAEGRLAS